MSTSKQKVLFICSGNSARSQMAEALLRHQAGDKFDVFSAGTAPRKIDDRTLVALSDFGLSGNQLTSKSIDIFADQHFDFVITLCDKARQECQNYPNTGQQIAWDFEDPKYRAERLPFQVTLNELNSRIAMFVLVQSKNQSETNTQPEIDPIGFYKCLTDEIRLKSLMLIQYQGELCVCELVAALKEIQPKISRHLALLRKSKILIDRKQEQWVYYRINPDLPAWAKSIIAQTTESNAGFIQENIDNLSLMGNRPGRGKASCQQTTEKGSL